MSSSSIYKNILYNGLDFLLHSLREIAITTDEENEDLVNTLPKYLVRDLVAATELVLKARLCKEHWSLIFQSIEKASLEALNTGGFSSVNFDTCIKRLEKIASVSLSRDSLIVFDKLRTQRNLYEHFRLMQDMYAIVPLAAQCLDTILDMMATWFDPSDFDIDTSRIREALRPRLSEFVELRQHRLQRLSEQLERLRTDNHLTKCPTCGENTLKIDPTNKCLFCHWAEEASKTVSIVVEYEEQLREKYKFQMTLFPRPPLPYVSAVYCPKCGVKSFLVRSKDRNGIEIASAICYSCGHSIGASSKQQPA